MYCFRQFSKNGCVEKVFPKEYVAFRLFLTVPTVPIENCEAECSSFPKLTIIRNIINRFTFYNV